MVGSVRPSRRAITNTVPIVAGGLLLLYGLATLHWRSLGFPQPDLRVYQQAAGWLVSGTPIYDQGASGVPLYLPFNYPPFAAALFFPLTLLSEGAGLFAVQLGNIALCAVVAWCCLRGQGRPAGSTTRALAIPVGVVILVMQPVLATLGLGQINMLVMTVVLADLVVPGDRRWRGVGVGIVAGIKLTPLIFVPYLLLTRQFRAAITATATFAATVAIGFAIDPADAVKFWFKGVMGDVSRISVQGPAVVGNQSLNGILNRTGLGDGAIHTLWLVGVVLALGACLLVSAMAYRRGQKVLAIGICGLGSAMASPFSWDHHWVWIAPIAVVLLIEAWIRRDWRLWVAQGLLWLTIIPWTVHVPYPPRRLHGTLFLNPGGWLNAVTHNIYGLVFVVVLAATAWCLRKPVEADVVVERERLPEAEVRT